MYSSILLSFLPDCQLRSVVLPRSMSDNHLLISDQESVSSEISASKSPRYSMVESKLMIDKIRQENIRDKFYRMHNSMVITEKDDRLIFLSANFNRCEIHSIVQLNNR